MSKKSKLIITTVLFFIGLLWMLKFWDLSTSVFLSYGEDYVNVGGDLFYIANWPCIWGQISTLDNLINRNIIEIWQGR